MKSAWWFTVFTFLLAACSPVTKIMVPVPASPTYNSALKGTARPSLPTATIPATATNAKPVNHPTQSVEDLRMIIYSSDPANPQYDPRSGQYAEFADTMKQLSAMGPNAIDAAGDIAHAISFPRQDSNLAAQTLISLGPDITATTLDLLIDNLHSQRSETRMNTAIVIGTIGKNASCAVGDIGPLLWDIDPKVRFTAAYALEGITGKDLLPNDAKVRPDPLSAQSILADTPEGKIVGNARNWWNTEGSKVNWHPSYDICDP